MLKRKLFDSIIQHLPAKEFSIIVGPRQSGKTTLLTQIADYLKSKDEQVYMFTLEDQTILTKLNEHPENIFNFVFYDRNHRFYLLIDEIQYLEDPSNFLKLLYDKHFTSLKIIATGSSAFYIDKKFKDSLAGRKKLFELYTLNFEEFLDFRSRNNELSSELTRIRDNDQYISLKNSEIESFFHEYLTFGGYPAVVLAQNTDEKKAILKELLYSFVKRDISESNITEEEKFYRLMLLLAHQTGSLVNVNELSTTLRLSFSAIENYLYALRKCFHITLLRPFYKNIRKELTKMPKVYFHDLGLRNMLMNQFNPVFQRPDKGEIIENFVFIRLREKIGLDSLFYWRTADGHEIDFIVRESLEEGYAIEVKYDYSTFNQGKFKKFTEAYPGFLLECRAFEAISSKNKVLTL
jgi:uncharacterized protein